MAGDRRNDPRHAPGALASHLITSAAPGSRLPFSAAATIARRSCAPSRGPAFLGRDTLPTTATPCRREPAHDDRFAGFSVVTVNVAAVVILSVGQQKSATAVVGPELADQLLARAEAGGVELLSPDGLLSRVTSGAGTGAGRRDDRPPGL